MAAPTSLAEFEHHIRQLAGKGALPFLCDGSPFGCEIFVVGINPATNISVWQCWSTNAGMDRNAWLESYRAERGDFLPTRRRLNRFSQAASPARVLETNVFSASSPRLAALAKAHRSRHVFEFLLSELRPKILFVHGRAARRQIEKMAKVELVTRTWATIDIGCVTVDILCERHLYNWSFDDVDRLGKELHDRWTSLGNCTSA
jgi:hypothetical protein